MTVDTGKVLSEESITSKDRGGSENTKVSGDSCSTKPVAVRRQLQYEDSYSTKTVIVIDGKFITVGSTRKFRKVKKWGSLIARSAISQRSKLPRTGQARCSVQYAASGIILRVQVSRRGSWR